MTWDRPSCRLNTSVADHLADGTHLGLITIVVTVLAVVIVKG